MPKFVVERNIAPGTVLSNTQLEATSLRSLEVLREMGAQIRWVHSFVTEEKVYCIYDAADESLIREHARRGGFATDRVMVVRRSLDPADFE